MDAKFEIIITTKTWGNNKPEELRMREQATYEQVRMTSKQGARAAIFAH